MQITPQLTVAFSAAAAQIIRWSWSLMLSRFSKTIFLSTVGLLAHGAVIANQLAPIDLRINYQQPLRILSDRLPFVCVTMDWWPNNKCDSPDGESDCAWVGSSILNARIAPPSRLKDALEALGNVTLRIGGTLADSITYAVGADIDIECPDFSPSTNEEKAKTFTGGCLRESRWREVLNFCNYANGCRLLMGLNGMRGRTCERHVDQSHAVCFDVYESCDDNWDSSNAESLIKTTAEWHYPIGGYELGNELNCLLPEQYENSLRQLNKIMETTSTDAGLAIPLLIATDSYEYHPLFLKQLLPRVADILSAVTWHDYPLHAGVECSGANAVNNTDVDDIIMDRFGMERLFLMADELLSIRDQAVPTASTATGPELWMGETGGAFNSGCNGSTNTFLSAFWYANAMGGFATRGHDIFCRQTLTGGNYELINKVTNLPNPDYFTALLFGRLMGKVVLGASTLDNNSEDHEVVVYAHCLPFNEYTAAGYYVEGAVTVMYLNYDAEERIIRSINGGQLSPRYEFILTGVSKPPSFEAKDALHSDIVALNGEPIVPLNDTDGTELFKLNAIVEVDRVEATVPGFSYGFFILPKADASACKNL